MQIIHHGDVKNVHKRGSKGSTDTGRDTCRQRKMREKVSNEHSVSEGKCLNCCAVFGWNHYWLIKKKEKKEAQNQKHPPDAENEGTFRLGGFFLSLLETNLAVLMLTDKRKYVHRSFETLRLTPTHTSPWWRVCIMSTRARANRPNGKSKQWSDGWSAVFRLMAGLESVWLLVVNARLWRTNLLTVRHKFPVVEERALNCTTQLTLIDFSASQECK